jgi:acetoin utilization deacetylase AcuC-like enzyme
MKIITDERCTLYGSPGHPERPARVSRTVERLKEQQTLDLTWDLPGTPDDAVLLKAHDPAHVQRVRLAAEAFDGDTPAHAAIFDHASRSVGGALKAMETARAGGAAFSLLRPPGHHATRIRAMGFCYLNAIAIAALAAQDAGSARVAVYDFDVHHGNGTEDILLNRPDTAFYSIHQHPCYPGTGTKNLGANVFNYPVRPRIPRDEYLATLARALEDLKRFKPDLIAVSAGFDAYARDPLAEGTLEAEDYHWLGRSLRQIDVPHFSILEGGYSNDLPDLVLAYLKGLSAA